MREISDLLGRKEYKLDAMHGRVLKILRKKLSSFVAEEFGVCERVNPNCIICCHPEREAIEEILRQKKPEDTFRPIYRELKCKFDLKISTPQILIGHMKYHMK